MSKKVLVVASHPDDEVLGCGAMIAKHCQQGDQVHVLIVAEGITSRDDSRDTAKNNTELNKLKEIAVKANKVLGVETVEFANFPDNRMDSLDLLDIVKPIEKKTQEFAPDIVYTHFPYDLNVDHRLTSEAVMVAMRPMPGKKPHEVIFFEVVSSTEWMMLPKESFSPDLYQDVTKTAKLKLEALEVYQGEMRPWPHARSIEGVKHKMHLRGSEVGVESAEAFKVGRIVR